MRALTLIFVTEAPVYVGLFESLHSTVLNTINDIFISRTLCAAWSTRECAWMKRPLSLEIRIILPSAISIKWSMTEEIDQNDHKSAELFIIWLQVIQRAAGRARRTVSNGEYFFSETLFFSTHFRIYLKIIFFQKFRNSSWSCAQTATMWTQRRCRSKCWSEIEYYKTNIILRLFLFLIFMRQRA